jgi:transcriptional regulator with XRE-family HTH domain
MFGRPKVAPPENLAVYEARKKSKLNQRDFWAQYGVTQSGGSRYETNRKIPLQVKLLMYLVKTKKITVNDIQYALGKVKAKKPEKKSEPVDLTGPYGS